MALKAIPQQEFKNFSNSGSITGLVHSCSRGVLQRWLLSV